MIGLSLCPWAKPVRDAGGLRYSITHAREAEGLSAALLHEIDLLQADAEIETTLLVHLTPSNPNPNPSPHPNPELNPSPNQVHPHVSQP